MKISKRFFIFLLFAFVAVSGYPQKKPPVVPKDKRGIEATIRGFLNWRKEQEKIDEGGVFAPIKGGPPDTTTQTRIDTVQVEQYIAGLKKTGYFSETLFNYLRSYYWEIDKRLAKD